MRYYARFSVGLLLGLGTAAGASYVGQPTSTIAAAGASVGVLAFLATFFIWNPDRAPSEEEPEGYEQVLFDARNNVHLLVMLMLVAGGAYGHAFAFGAADGGSAAVDPAEAQMDVAHDDLVGMVEAFNAAHSAFVDGAADAAVLAAQQQAATALRLELDRLDVSGALEERRELLSDAAAYLSAAFSSLAACAEQGETTCIDARVLQGQAADAIEDQQSAAA